MARGVDQHIYMTDETRALMQRLARRWGLSLSAAVARALELADAASE